ncbi:MarR family winged helix-turn-helix transcriptional regulator [Rheinheimera tilapiae]|jgi:DNA-binding MarR family transcriptional regulator|uniref:MarR family winged helix-turn-helix transcriptional regulator n=1 Tax=Rheinheimera tilapiae TaxID=875043 RepID=A0ABV6B8B8_9GAMM
MMSEPIVEQLVIELGNLQARIQKKVGSALSVHGLGLSDYFVLNQLYVAPTQTMRRHDLAELVGLSPSGITRLLLPLEKIGLVEKETNPRDARVSLVILSAAGKQLYEDARLSFAEASSQLFKSLNAEQQNNLLAMLQALR